jgi:hypothetical protein
VTWSAGREPARISTHVVIQGSKSVRGQLGPYDPFRMVNDRFAVVD